MILIFFFLVSKCSGFKLKNKKQNTLIKLQSCVVYLCSCVLSFLWVMRKTHKLDHYFLEKWKSAVNTCRLRVFASGWSQFILVEMLQEVEATMLTGGSAGCAHLLVISDVAVEECSRVFNRQLLCVSLIRFCFVSQTGSVIIQSHI